MECKNTEQSIRNTIFAIALPITLQSIFQSSFSLIDQVMVGDLGTNTIAAIGFGCRLPTIFNFTIGGIATCASIMIAQYCGKKDKKGVNQSFFANCIYGFLLTFVFALLGICIPDKIIRIFSTDYKVIPMAADYLRIVSFGYLPTLVILMLSSVLRNTGKAKYPMYAGIATVGLNTLFNYIFIYGKFGFPRMGLEGAAFATLLSTVFECILLVGLFLYSQRNTEFVIHYVGMIPKEFMTKTFLIAIPIIATEFLWSFGETVFGVIYGRMGTSETAAMTLTYPLQGLTVGLFSGVSSAASILTGNALGEDKQDFAYDISKKILKFGIIGTVVLGMILAFMSQFYVKLFNISEEEGIMTIKLLCIFGAFLCIKVSNMILSGVLKSGGQTKYVLIIETIGTWVVGIPIGFFTAFVLKLPISYVYCFITTEEIVRLILGARLFRGRKWMHNITVDGEEKLSKAV